GQRRVGWPESRARRQRRVRELRWIQDVGERARGLPDRRQRGVRELQVRGRRQDVERRRVQGVGEVRREGPRERHVDDVHDVHRERDRDRGEGPEGLMRARRVLMLAAGLGLAASLAGAAPKKAAPATPPAPAAFLGYSYTEAGDASLNGIGLQGTFP